MSTTNSIFFTCDDSIERLEHTCAEDAIEQHLDSLLSPKMTAVEVLKALPETVTVYEYTHKKPDAVKLAERCLENLLEDLDEGYGDPDDRSTDPTPTMKGAALNFMCAILSEYQVWACDKKSKETINVEEWVKENRPDWLEDLEVKK